MQANFNLWTEIRGHRRVADFLVEVMHVAGVTHAFAMPAESLNPILDAVRKNGRVRLITVRHEGNGALMASAFAKLSGKLSVCMGTAGPGASHLPLGAYDAKGDGAPLLAVTGQVPLHQVGTGGFQEIDSVALFRDAAGFNRLVSSPQQTALLPQACAQAIYQRGPAHVAFPSDVLGTGIDQRTIARFRPEWLVPGQMNNRARIRQAADKLSAGSDTVVVVGGGTEENLREAVEALADRLRAPVLVFPEGIHYFRERPRFPTIRMGIRAGDPALGLLRAVRQAIIIGNLNASHRLHFPFCTSWVHVASSREIGRTENPGWFRVVGEMTPMLSDLAGQIATHGGHGLLQQARALSSCERDQSTQPERDFWAVLNGALPADSTLAIEPGMIFDSAFFNLGICQRTITTSFNHRIPGYAFPAGVAAALAYPERSSWVLATPAGLAESMPDLLSAKKHSVAVKTICIESQSGEVVGSIDFGRFARSAGYQVYAAHDAASLVEAVTNCNKNAVPSVICTNWEAAVRPSDRAYEVTPVRSPALLGGIGQTLATFLIEAFHKAGVTRIYGPARRSMHGFLSQLCGDGRITFIGATHPESASMMASAYAKWTGRVGICLVRDEQDLIFQLNGLYDAAFDRSPVLILTACDSNHGCQEFNSKRIDPRQLLRDVVVSNVHIGPNLDACQLLEQALRDAAQYRAVVHICFDWNLLSSPCTASLSGFDPAYHSATLLPPADLICEAARRLSAAKRPAILVGRGAHGAQKEILEIARMLGCPVACTLPGRSVISVDWPQFVGGIGASGHRAAIQAVRRSDVLLVLGSSNRGAVFGFRGKFFLIQIDSDPLQLGRRTQEVLGLYGTTKETLQELNRVLAARLADSSSGQAQAGQRSSPVNKHRRRFEKWLETQHEVVNVKGRLIQPAAICQTLVKVLKDLSLGRPIITVDVGVTTVWVYRHLLGSFDFVWTSSFATMGFSLPAAIAIRELEPSRPVIGIAGDGGIGLTMAELCTAVRLGLCLVMIVFNNGKLAAIKYEQEVMGWPEYESALYNCDFTEYARSCGAHGIRVTRFGDLHAALQEALTCGGPCVVDVSCDPHAMPAPPQIHPLQAAGYALAISREIGLYLHRVLGRNGSSV